MKIIVHYIHHVIYRDVRIIEVVYIIEGAAAQFAWRYGVFQDVWSEISGKIKRILEEKFRDFIMRGTFKNGKPILSDDVIIDGFETAIETTDSQYQNAFFEQVHEITPGEYLKAPKP